jgi:uncharacterized pyridoxal phosphate-containing UPF0001 family protein
MMEVLSVQKNLFEVMGRLRSATERSGRRSDEILVLAISKTMPVHRIQEAIAAGQRHFGENRVQEARDKIPQLGDGLVWHLVGHLQSNKAKYCFPWPGRWRADTVKREKFAGPSYRSMSQARRSSPAVNHMKQLTS